MLKQLTQWGRQGLPMGTMSTFVSKNVIKVEKTIYIQDHMLNWFLANSLITFSKWIIALKFQFVLLPDFTGLRERRRAQVVPERRRDRSPLQVDGRSQEDSSRGSHRADSGSSLVIVILLMSFSLILVLLTVYETGTILIKWLFLPSLMMVLLRFVRCSDNSKSNVNLNKSC